MSVQSIASPVATAATSALSPPAVPAPAPNGALSSNDFLQLLVASLKYQDPSEPMKTQELMAQSTQMTTVEQLIEVARLSQESFALQQRNSAISLVGRTVAYSAGDGSRDGVVTAVDLTGPTPVLHLGSVEVSMTDVTRVTDQPASAPRPTTSGSAPSAA